MSFTDAAATWNQRFSTDAFLFGTAPNAWLVDHAHHLAPASRILCIADGEGRNSVWLARQGHRVDAFDISPVGQAKAVQLAAAAGVAVNYAVCDGDAVEWPLARYDTIAAIFIQYADPPARARMFERIVRALKPGGVLILQGYTPKQIEYKTGGPPFVANLYTAPLLREAFATLEIVELSEYEAVLAEGSGHAGRSALIGLVARKPA